MVSQGRDAAIVGIHEYPSRDVEGKVNALQIKAASAAKALADAGLNWSDVDAIYDAGEGALDGEGVGLREVLVAAAGPLHVARAEHVPRDRRGDEDRGDRAVAHRGRPGRRLGLGDLGDEVEQEAHGAADERPRADGPREEAAREHGPALGPGAPRRPRA